MATPDRLPDLCRRRGRGRAAAGGRGAHALARIRGAERARRRPCPAQARMPAADRIVQVPGRLQCDQPDRRGGRGRLLVRQPRPGRGRRGEAAGQGARPSSCRRTRPAIKIESTRARGAEVRLYDRATESREEIGAEIAARTGAALIRPYDDPRIIAGQGTVGLELAQQAKACGLELELALVPCGGGGLIAGCALALSAAFPGIALYAVEPAGLDDTARSLEAGARQTNAPGATSICDALLLPTPGELTFALNRRLLAGGLAVTRRRGAKRHGVRVPAPEARGGAGRRGRARRGAVGQAAARASDRRRGALRRQRRPGAVAAAITGRSA